MGFHSSGQREPLPAFGRRSSLRTKTDVAAAVCRGVMSAAEATARYGLTLDELLAYKEALKLVKLSPADQIRGQQSATPLDTQEMGRELNKLV